MPAHPLEGIPPAGPPATTTSPARGTPHPHAPGGVALRSVSGLRCIDGGVDDGNAGRDGAPFEHVQLRAETGHIGIHLGVGWVVRGSAGHTRWMPVDRGY